MKVVCMWLIRLYQRLISPLKRQPTCRFTPTCSAYALEAFEKRGFFVGLYLSVCRIARCQPFCAGGYDPVPPKGQLRRVRIEQEREQDNELIPPPKTVCEDYVERRPRRRTAKADSEQKENAEG